MDKRKLGSAGPEVPVICLGGNVYGWTLPESEAFRQLDAARRSRIEFCGYRRCVFALGSREYRAASRRRLSASGLPRAESAISVILATKVGMDMSAGKKGLKAAYIRQSVEDSLQRLQTDYIDIYQAHKRRSQRPRWKKR